CFWAYSSSGWTCTESFSCGKINFTSKGMRDPAWSRRPFHSAESPGQDSPSERPIKGPEAKVQRSPVSHTSPIGSVAAGELSNSGAKLREPQMGGTKSGARREEEIVTERRLPTRRSARACAILPRCG